MPDCPIESHIRAKREFLVVELISGQARVCNQDDIVRRPHGQEAMQLAVVDLKKVYRRFNREAPPKQTFTLSEIAALADEKGPTVNVWAKAGVLTPSIRDRSGVQGRAMLFDRTDAFVACLVASLKRTARLPLVKLMAVSAAVRVEGKKTRRLKSKRKALA